ncbi:MAG: hypothetical protein IJW83_03275 [Clostridia bacterium]|nr:hypothetical protein [Clostridia bacterium]
MAQTQMSELIRTSLETIRQFLDTDAYIGTPIETLNGVTVIPVSRINVAIAAGGVDYAAKRLTQNQNFGGGSGGGISVTPIAFLTIRPDASVELIPVTVNPIDATLAKIGSAIEQIPDILKRIKNSIF